MALYINFSCSMCIEYGAFNFLAFLYRPSQCLCFDQSSSLTVYDAAQCDVDEHDFA